MVRGAESFRCGAWSAAVHGPLPVGKISATSHREGYCHKPLLKYFEGHTELIWLNTTFLCLQYHQPNTKALIDLLGRPSIPGQQCDHEFSKEDRQTSVQW